MKKPALLIFVVLLSLSLLAACKGGQHSIPPEADVSVASLPQDADGNPAATTSEVPVSDFSEAEPHISSPPPVLGDQGEEHSVTGTIDDVAAGQVYLLLDDGRVIAFDYTNANIDKWSDTMPGARATIYYYGDLADGETAGFVATRVETTK